VRARGGGIKADHARIDQLLSKAQVPEHLRYLVTPNVVFPLIVWSRMFLFLDEANIEELREWPVEEVICWSTSQVTSVSTTPGNTQKKCAKHAGIEEEIGSDLEEAMTLSGSPPMMVSCLDAPVTTLSKFEGHEDHDSIIDAVYLQWNQLIDFLVGIQDRGHQTLTIEEVDMFFVKVDEKVNYLAVLVGKPSKIEEDDSGINLFGAVRMLTTDIEDLKGLMNWRTDKLTEQVAIMDQKVSSPTSGGLKGAWTMLDIIFGWIRELSNQMPAPGFQFNPLAAIDLSINEYLNDHGTRIEAEKTRIANLEMTFRLTGAPAPSGTTIDEYILNQTLHELRADVRQLVTQVRNKLVAMGPYHFGCLEDVVDFV
jgi:hypothetical protein